MTEIPAKMALAAGLGLAGAYLLWRLRPAAVHAVAREIRPFDTPRFTSELATKSLGRHFEHRQSVGSTMAEASPSLARWVRLSPHPPQAKALCAGPSSHGLAVMAEEQTSGVGRRNRGCVPRRSRRPLSPPTHARPAG